VARTLDELTAASGRCHETVLPTVPIGRRRADRTASYVDVDSEEAADIVMPMRGLVHRGGDSTIDRWTSSRRVIGRGKGGSLP
jgi:hypothetical protein